MKMSRGWRRPALALAALLAAGCADRAAENPSGDGTPVRGGTVVIGGINDLDNLNSLVSAEKFSQEIIREMLFLPLIRYDAGLDYEPALARSWELLGDTGVIFHLRDDVRWHDGMPTTAADVMFTYERAVDPETAFPSADYFASWTSAKQIDSLTVQFTFEPHAEPLAGLPFLPIMPRHMLDSIAPSRMRQASFNKKPVGNGPFKFGEYRANDRWVFLANDDYPAELGGRPYLDRVVWRVIPDATVQLTEIQTGTLDITPAKTDQVKSLANAPNLRTIVRPSRQYAIVGWNGRRAPFDQAVVRRALSMAMDRQAFIQTLRGGYGTLAVGPIGPFHWAYDSTLTALPFNPDSARALLRSANIQDRDGDGVAELPDGKPFEIELLLPANSIINRDMAAMITANLSQVGVRVTPKAVEATTMFATISDSKRDFDAVIVAWESDFRINLRDIFHSSALGGPFQLASYSNPKVDSLIDFTARTKDRAKAKPAYQELQRILREEQPWSFLYYFPDVYLVRDRVHGVEMDIRSSLLTVGKWWVSPAAGSAAQSDSADRSHAPD